MRRWPGSLALVAVLVGCAAPPGDAPPVVLLFAGAGTSPNDVAAVEAILRAERLPYATATSAQLDAMDGARLRAYRLLIVPGGDFERIGNGLTPRATANVRSAVHQGLAYLGLCAGAFLAGDSPYNGLNLTGGTRFRFYAAESLGVRKTAVAITTASGERMEHYWEDDPQLAGWGAVVARYPDGTPAVVQGRYGAGAVILTGTHPEAPASWRRGLDFRTPAGDDHAYAATLVRAALDRESLPRF